MDGRLREAGDVIREQKRKYAILWFQNLCRFHHVKDADRWNYTAEHVVAFLRAQLAKGTPTWKRLKIVEGLMFHCMYVRKTDATFLSPICIKLKEWAAKEHTAKKRTTDGGEEIEESPRPINPKEWDVIRALRTRLRAVGHKYTTEKSYVGRVKAFMNERGMRCLKDFEQCSSEVIESHLTDLAVDGNVAPSTQNQAYFALQFLFEHVLKRSMGEINAKRSTKAPNIPCVMSVEEVQQVLGMLTGVYAIIGKLLYGCGMRISECLRLRVKDFDFDQMLIAIHDSKGGKSRFVPLPKQMVDPLKKLIASRRDQHDKDLSSGVASVWLPHALARKYPAAHQEFGWQFIFASAKLSRDPRTRKYHRHHLHSDTFPVRLREAVKRVGLVKHITSHTFRHSFATHLLDSNTDIRTIQELLGHKDIQTTMIYTHVLKRKDIRVVSPLDRLCGEGKNDGSSYKGRGLHESCSTSIGDDRGGDAVGCDARGGDSRGCDDREGDNGGGVKEKRGRRKKRRKREARLYEQRGHVGLVISEVAMEQAMGEQRGAIFERGAIDVLDKTNVCECVVGSQRVDSYVERCVKSCIDGSVDSSLEDLRLRSGLWCQMVKLGLQIGRYLSRVAGKLRGQEWKEREVGGEMRQPGMVG